MKINSYNITDISYHYIGLRVLAGTPSSARREEQTNTISRSVLKYVSDRALRLMLPEPKGTFETVGEKICQELVHLKFAQSIKGAYRLSDDGRYALNLLNEGKVVDLRRLMAIVHLKTYDNLRAVVQKYLDEKYIWMPIIEAKQLATEDYIQLLKPTFNGDARTVAESILEKVQNKNPKKIEDALRESILHKVFPDLKISVPLFRSFCDRLVSLRLLNIKRVKGEFAKSYSPCAINFPSNDWYVTLHVPIASDEIFKFYFCEPDMSKNSVQDKLITALDKAFSELPSEAGYYDLPDIRDFVCEYLRIPEAAFDEGINYLLDRKPAILTAGLHYEGISGRRKPLSRNRGTTQIYNLLRRI